MPDPAVPGIPNPSPHLAAKKPDNPPPSQIFLVSYPKIVFLYPSFLASIVCGIVMLFGVKESTSHLVSLIFLAIFATNLMVMAFDFPRTTSLTLFFFLVALGIGLWSLFKFNENLLPAVTDVIGKLNPEANSTFYFTLVVVFSLMYVCVMVTRQFDYWEVRPNELLHHHGFMSDLKRYATPNLRIEKEITDVFEFMLLRSGRLIMHPSSEPRAIVLENVVNIDHKEAMITRMLGSLQVRMAPPGEDV